MRSGWIWNGPEILNTCLLYVMQLTGSALNLIRLQGAYLQVRVVEVLRAAEDVNDRIRQVAGQQFVFL